MKKGFLLKLVALALALVFTGCQAAGSLPQKNESKAMRIIDDSAQEEYPFASEYPAISDEPQLPEDAVAASLNAVAVKKAPAEVKSVWLSFLEMQNLLTGKSEKEFTSNMRAVFDNIKSFGFNTVVIQVRPYADAFYRSDYFPWSHIVSGTEGEDPGFDPFEIMVTEAKSRGLRIEAWINPYRVRPAGNSKALSDDNQAKIWLDAKDDSVIKYNGVISYNPASTKAQTLIVNGIKEIVRNYDVDGVHIDDYFYPTTDKAFDKAAYTRYAEGGGKLGLADWRRSNVEKLVKKIYAGVKSVNKNVMFGISPQSSVENNYNAQYLDVEKIASTSGYCDYICPQIYFGFENAVQPYAETLDKWTNMVTAPGVKLYVGLAAYKAGVTDTWAGAGKNEWSQNTDLLARMVAEARTCQNYGGVVIYRYDSLFNPAAGVKTAVQKEARNLKEALK